MIVDDSFSRLTTYMIVHDSFGSAVVVITGPIAVRKHTTSLFRREKFLLLQVCLTGRHLVFAFLHGKILELAGCSVTLLARLRLNYRQL